MTLTDSGKLGKMAALGVRKAAKVGLRRAFLGWVARHFKLVPLPAA